jgi:hypothetical protein
MPLKQLLRKKEWYVHAHEVFSCEIWGSHGGDDDDVLGSDAV